MRLIDADALLREFETNNRVFHPNGLWHIAGIRALIESIPTIIPKEYIERIADKIAKEMFCEKCATKEMCDEWKAVRTYCGKYAEVLKAVKKVQLER